MNIRSCQGRSADDSSGGTPRSHRLAPRAHESDPHDRPSRPGTHLHQGAYTGTLHLWDARAGPREGAHSRLRRAVERPRRRASRSPGARVARVAVDDETWSAFRELCGETPASVRLGELVAAEVDRAARDEAPVRIRSPRCGRFVSTRRARRLRPGVACSRITRRVIAGEVFGRVKVLSGCTCRTAWNDWTLHCSRRPTSPCGWAYRGPGYTQPRRLDGCLRPARWRRRTGAFRRGGPRRLAGRARRVSPENGSVERAIRRASDRSQRTTSRRAGGKDGATAGQLAWRMNDHAGGHPRTVDPPREVIVARLWRLRRESRVGADALDRDAVVVAVQ